MIDAILQATPFPVVEQLARFAQARHTVLAGNIANLDTPGYQARDLSPELFRRRLAEALAAQRSAALQGRVSIQGSVGTQGSVGMQGSVEMQGGAGLQGDAGLQGGVALHGSEMPRPARRTQVAEVTSNLKSLLRHDENDVSLEQQVAAVAKNQLEHNLALAVMSNQIRLLQAAISERV